MSNTPHHLDIDNIAERSDIKNEHISMQDIESGKALVRTDFLIQDLVSFIPKASIFQRKFIQINLDLYQSLRMNIKSLQY